MGLFHLKVGHPEALLRSEAEALEQWRRSSLGALLGPPVNGEHWTSPDLPYEGIETLRSRIPKGQQEKFPLLRSFVERGTLLLPFAIDLQRMELLGRTFVVASSERLGEELALLRTGIALPTTPEESKKKLFAALGVDPSDPIKRDKKWVLETTLALWAAIGFAARWRVPVWSMRGDRTPVSQPKPPHSAPVVVAVMPEENGSRASGRASSSPGEADVRACLELGASVEEQASELWLRLGEWLETKDEAFHDVDSLELSEEEVERRLDDAAAWVPIANEASAWRSAARFFEWENWHGLVAPACARACRLPEWRDRDR